MLKFLLIYFGTLFILFILKMIKDGGPLTDAKKDYINRKVRDKLNKNRTPYTEKEKAELIEWSKKLH